MRNHHVFYILISGLLFLWNTDLLQSQCSSSWYYTYLWQTSAGGTQNICVTDPLNAPSTVTIKKAPMPVKLCLSSVYFSKVNSSITCDPNESILDLTRLCITNTLGALNGICDNISVDLTEVDESCEISQIAIMPITSSVSGPFKDNPYATLGKADVYIANNKISGTLAVNFSDNLINGGNLNGTKYPPKCYSSDCPQSTSANRDCLNLETILMHEMLHVLGLGHVNNQGNPKDPFKNPCNTASNFPDMDKETLFHDINHGKIMQNKSTISQYTECALKKLYCPTLTSIRELVVSSASSPQLNVFPQPSNNQISFIIRSLLPDLKMEIYNELGEVLERRSITMRDMSYTVTLNVNTYQSGVYYAVVSSKEGITATRFIVTH